MSAGSSDLLLRQYRPEDFDDIRSWIGDRRTHAFWCAGRFRFPPEPEDFRQVLARAAESAGEAPFTAELAGKAAGFFCWSADRETNAGKLRFVVLDPALRGRGLGQALLRLALRHAFGEWGAETVLLSVFPENLRAKRCYEAVGFRELSTAEGVFTFGEERWGRCSMGIRKEDFERTREPERP